MWPFSLLSGPLASDCVWLIKLQYSLRCENLLIQLSSTTESPQLSRWTIIDPELYVHSNAHVVTEYLIQCGPFFELI